MELNADITADVIGPPAGKGEGPTGDVAIDAFESDGRAKGGREKGKEGADCGGRPTDDDEI